MKTNSVAYLVVLSLTVAAAAVVLGFSIFQVLTENPGYQWLILAYLTILSGAFTFQLKSFRSQISAADTFIFVNAMLFGPAVGALTAALDGLLATVRLDLPWRKKTQVALRNISVMAISVFAGSLRCKTRERRFEFMIFNVTAMAMAAYAAGEIFFWLFWRGPLYADPELAAGRFFLPTTLLGIGYYLLNATGVAIIVALQAREGVSRVWSKSLLWGTATATVSALGAVFVAASVLAVTPVAAAATLLLLGVIYVACRAFTEHAAAPALQ